MSFVDKAKRNSYIFVYWLVLSVIVGMVTGFAGAFFHKAISFATLARTEHPYLIYFLPLGGVAIAFMYRLSKDDLSTNTVINCIRKSKSASALLAPFIFIGAFITHLFGGSAGREGAALQIGGGIGSRIAYRLHMNEEDAGIMMVCGMSGAFSAIFTTPVTAAVLALEIVSVGHMRYFQMLPCIVSSICGFIITNSLGNAPLFYDIPDIPILDAAMCIKVTMLGIICAFLSTLFCVTLHYSEKTMKKFFPKDYIRAFAGGCIIIALTLAVGCRDYNGAGMDIIGKALSGEAKPEAFLLKLIFTAVTIGAGFKGGEIVPAFFVGSTFGAVLGGMIGIDPAFAAALSLVCVFCGIANCPLASVILGVELFGSSGIIFFTLVCAISFIVSGRFGLYRSQKIVYSQHGISHHEHYVK